VRATKEKNPCKRKSASRSILSTELVRAKAVEMKLAGRPYSEIGPALGLSSVRAFQLVREAMQEAVTVPASELLQVELERLDRLTSAVWAKAIAGDHGEIDMVLKLMDRRARLLGLYPQQEPATPGVGVFGSLARASISVEFVEASHEEPSLELEAS